MRRVPYTSLCVPAVPILYYTYYGGIPTRIGIIYIHNIIYYVGGRGGASGS